MTATAPEITTAPPTQRPIFTAGPYPLSQTPTLSAATDGSGSWAQMAPTDVYAQGPHGWPLPTTNRTRGRNGLLFITGSKPADFKDRRVMTQVRKQAMDSYLTKEKKPRNRSRKQSEANVSTDTSPSSVGSDQQDPIDAYMSERATSDSTLRVTGEEMEVVKKASPIQSQATSALDRGSAPRCTQTSPFSAAIDVVLSSAPMVQPKRIGITFPYMEFAPGLLQSVGKPLDPFRTMFQSCHQHVSVEGLKFDCHQYFGTKAMGIYWIPTLIKSPHAFLSTLCIASAHNDALHDRAIESLYTTALRQEVIHLIHQNILNPQTQIDDYNIIALTQLIASELIAGEAHNARCHEFGVEKMVTLRGGLPKLGVNGRLASTLSWVSLASAVFREARASTMYADYCASHSSRTYPNTATIPESPLFLPRGEYHTVERSPQCMPRTLNLLKDVRMMLELFLHETKHTRQNIPSLKSLYKRITTEYPSVAVLQQSNVITRSDWMCEAIRIAAVIQATAIMQRVPLSEALIHAAELEDNPSVYPGTDDAESNASLGEQTAFRHDSPVTCSLSASPAYATATPAQQQPQYQQQSYLQPAPLSSYSPHSTSSSSYSSNPFFPFPSPFPTSKPPASPAHTLLQTLRTAISSADLSTCWADMAGVLLWVSLVASAASRKQDKATRKWFTAVAMRCSILLCFEHPEGIHAAMAKMGELVDVLGRASGSAAVTRERGSARKKRRV